MVTEKLKISIGNTQLDDPKMSDKARVHAAWRRFALLGFS